MQPQDDTESGAALTFTLILAFLFIIAADQLPLVIAKKQPPPDDMPDSPYAYWISNPIANTLTTGFTGPDAISPSPSPPPAPPGSE